MSETPIKNLDADDFMVMETVLELENDCLIQKLNQCIAALKPFAHEDFCKELHGNTKGDDSIIFQRDKAKITLGDCRRAAKTLKEVRE